MVSTTAAYQFFDVDFQLDTDGEVFRAKSITVTKTVEGDDQTQMGKKEYDFVEKKTKWEWQITIDEIAGNFTTLDAWADGSTSHILKISKGAATLTLPDARCMSLQNTSGDQATSQIILSGDIISGGTPSES